MRNLWLIVSSLSLALVGCGRGVEADGADDAEEAVTVSSAESALTAEITDEASQPASMTPENLAASSAARIPNRFKPQGCATAVQSGNTVTYTLTNCTGPYGLVKVSGTLVAVYTRAAGGGVNVVITGSGLKANDATIDVNSTVVATQANGVKKAEVAVNGSGTGPRGNTLTRKGAYTITFDTNTECVTVDGSWTTGSSRVASASTVVSGYERCKGSCPAAGGSIVHTGANKAVVTLSYDGSAVATWVSSTGRSGTVNLRCGAQP